YYREIIELSFKTQLIVKVDLNFHEKFQKRCQKCDAVAIFDAALVRIVIWPSFLQALSPGMFESRLLGFSPQRRMSLHGRSRPVELPWFCGAPMRRRSLFLGKH